MDIIKPREQLSRKLNSVERQVSENLDGIEHWHKWRYNKALDFIENGDIVIDLGCGCGYGSYILSSAAKSVTGIDDSEEAIQFANKHYKTVNNRFDNKGIFDVEGAFDVVVAFEIIELQTPTFANGLAVFCVMKKA